MHCKTPATFAALATAALLAACVAPPPDTSATRGAALYDAACAACHGSGGSGGSAPALTGLAAAPGGFDRVAVMSRIDGYTRRGHGSAMPEFGAALEGETVLVDTGDGVMTPTPAALVALAAHLESVQE
jgi:mono/diheme cytochrome c family protein